MSVQPPPGTTGPIGVPLAKTRMTKAWGHFTYALAKTTPRHLAKSRKATSDIKRLFIVPARRGTRGR